MAADADWLTSALQDLPSVRTIFIAGLPNDCTERELHLLFYEGGACEAIKLQHGNRGPQAFVQFPTPERAMQALEVCKGMVYDPASPSEVLRVEFARADFRKLPALGGQPPPPPGPPPSQAGGVKRPWQQQPGAPGGPPASVPRLISVGGGGGGAAQQQTRNASTLFIGSIGESVGQAELHDFCSVCMGFVRVTMRGEGTAKATAWAEFSSPDHAQTAREMLAEFPLPSLGRPPRLEFAKSDTTQGAIRPKIVPVAAAGPPPQINGSPVSGGPISFGVRQLPTGGGGGFTAAGPLGDGGGCGGSPRGGGGGQSSTLFIGGLDEQVEEQELSALASTQAGFLSLSCRNLGRPRATAWAQYDSPGNAASACEALRELPLPSMGRPANIEIARSDSRR